MGDPCGREGGQKQRNERSGEKIAAQDVECGLLLHGAERCDAGFFVKGMRDDVAEGKVQDGRGDAQHEDEREEKLGEDSAGHGGRQGTGFKVQGTGGPMGSALVVG
jgi:hypothetical protein